MDFPLRNPSLFTLKFKVLSHKFVDDRGERLEFRLEKSKSNKAKKIVIDIKSNSAGIDD